MLEGQCIRCRMWLGGKADLCYRCKMQLGYNPESRWPWWINLAHGYSYDEDSSDDEDEQWMVEQD